MHLDLIVPLIETSNPVPAFAGWRGCYGRDLSSTSIMDRRTSGAATKFPYTHGDRGGVLRKEEQQKGALQMLKLHAHGPPGYFGPCRRMSHQHISSTLAEPSPLPPKVIIKLNHEQYAPFQGDDAEMDTKQTINKKQNKTKNTSNRAGFWFVSKPEPFPP